MKNNIYDNINQKIKLNNLKHFKKNNQSKQIPFFIIMNYLKKKHNSNKSTFKNYLMDSLVKQKKGYFLAKFREISINDIDEFLYKYYRKKESIKKIKIYPIYYKNYSFYFCNPLIIDFACNNILCNYIAFKAEIFYENNYAEKKKNDNVGNFNIFNSELINQIEKISKRKKIFFGFNNLNNDNSSIDNISNIISISKRIIYNNNKHILNKKDLSNSNSLYSIIHMITNNSKKEKNINNNNNNNNNKNNNSNNINNNNNNNNNINNNNNNNNSNNNNNNNYINNLNNQKQLNKIPEIILSFDRDKNSKRNTNPVFFKLNYYKQSNSQKKRNIFTNFRNKKKIITSQNESIKLKKSSSIREIKTNIKISINKNNNTTQSIMKYNESNDKILKNNQSSPLILNLKSPIHFSQTKLNNFSTINKLKKNKILYLNSRNSNILSYNSQIKLIHGKSSSDDILYNRNKTLKINKKYNFSSTNKKYSCKYLSLKNYKENKINISKVNPYFKHYEKIIPKVGLLKSN